MSDTFLENLLFGEPFDAPKLKRVIAMCALEEDLKMLPNGL